MKKLLLAITVISSLTLGTSFQKTIENKSDKEFLECKYGQCSATAKSTGLRCRNCCQEGSSTCWSHR